MARKKTATGAVLKNGNAQSAGSPKSSVPVPANCRPARPDPCRQ